MILFRFPLALVGRLVEVFVKARGLQREFDAFTAVPAQACPTPRGRGGDGEAVSASPGDAPASPSLITGPDSSSETAISLEDVAVQMICDVLESHRFSVTGSNPGSYEYHCVTGLGTPHEHFQSRGYPGALNEWGRHVAPLIAQRLKSAALPWSAAYQWPDYSFGSDT